MILYDRFCLKKRNMTGGGAARPDDSGFFWNTFGISKTGEHGGEKQFIGCCSSGPGYRQGKSKTPNPSGFGIFR